MRNSPWFNHEYLRQLAAGQQEGQSLKELWSLCIRNETKLPSWSFHDDRPLVYSSAGPNGALLASILCAQRGRQIHLWINDDAGRYGKLSALCQDPPADSSDTLVQGASLAKRQATGTACEVSGQFPQTLPGLAEWLGRGAVRTAPIRLGFLDPDNYAEGGTQVAPADHQRWLDVLADDSDKVVSAIFSGCQNRGAENVARDQRLGWFHEDAVDLYPLSVMFEYGGFQTGVKIRWPKDAIQAAVEDLRLRVEVSWRGWSPSLGPLTVHLNGEPGHR